LKRTSTLETAETNDFVPLSFRSAFQFHSIQITQFPNAAEPTKAYGKMRSYTKVEILYSRSILVDAW